MGAHASNGSDLISDDMRYKLMRLLEANPELSQRDVARTLGVSIGKVNYCLRALVRRGWIKAANFTNSRNKAAYMYLLTPRGIDAKASITLRFLQAKMREYEALKAEIEQIRQEAESEAQRQQARRCSDSGLQ
jgi:MarR family transcriptional regulator, temperature-dependent positive regulator of motility